MRRCHVTGGPHRRCRHARQPGRRVACVPHERPHRHRTRGQTDRSLRPSRCSTTTREAIGVGVSAAAPGRASPPDVPGDLRRRSRCQSSARAALRATRIDGDGGDTGPDLTDVGARRDAVAIRRIITDPNDEYGDSVMPIYGGRLSEAQIAGARRAPGRALVGGRAPWAPRSARRRWRCRARLGRPGLALVTGEAGDAAERGLAIGWHEGREIARWVQLAASSRSSDEPLRLARVVLAGEVAAACDSRRSRRRGPAPSAASRSRTAAPVSSFSTVIVGPFRHCPVAGGRRCSKIC